jgi:muramoyltetrapeptide carboxypeptidase LdcA involved in peptidoglycan recycling
LFAEIADQLGVPAVIDLPIGHVEHNWTIPLGTHGLLDANAAALHLTEAAVRAG